MRRRCHIQHALLFPRWTMAIKSDPQLRQGVLDELDFEPSINADHIGVAVWSSEPLNKAHQNRRSEIGASCRLLPLLAKVPSPKEKRPFRLCGRNWSSCPTADLRPAQSDNAQELLQLRAFYPVASRGRLSGRRSNRWAVAGYTEFA